MRTTTFAQETIRKRIKEKMGKHSSFQDYSDSWGEYQDYNDYNDCSYPEVYDDNI